MKQKKTSPQRNPKTKQVSTASSLPYSSLSWSSLTDFQKSKLLLDSNRHLDADQFLREFKSFESPDKYSE